MKETKRHQHELHDGGSNSNYDVKLTKNLKKIKIPTFHLIKRKKKYI